MPFREGDRFGRYIIGPLLGQGGMGAVHRAEDTVLERAVALKILLHDSTWGPGVAPSAEAVARLTREARAAASLDHPNAVAIFDVGEEHDHAYIAMELIAGTTLRTLVGDAAQPLDRRIRWSLEVARALAAAHRRGIIHRDVKPENVMVRDDGVVKVLDFGIARRTAIPEEDLRAAEDAAAEPLREAPHLPTLTANGLPSGTPLYLAPEQLRGEELDPRADQFAWATVTYELLTGRSPWATDAGSLEVLSNILVRRAAPMRAANPRVPGEVDEIVRRALSKDRGERFASMDDVVRALEPHAGVALERRAATVPPQRVKRRRTLIVTIALVAAAMAALLFVVRTRRAKSHALAAHEVAPPLPEPAAARTEGGSRLSANVEATAAYRAGMQALRDAALETAREQFHRAASADPAFAAAYLGLLRAAWDMDDDLRDAFRKATAARLSLGEHDRALLATFAPWMETPPDLKGMEARLERITESEPENVDALVLLGKARHLALHEEASLAPLDAALRLDPTRAEALNVRALSYVELERSADALNDLHRCIAVAPGATTCLRHVNGLQANEGRCAEAEDTARAIIKLEPNGSRGYRLLARALYGEGRPLEAVRLALDQVLLRSHTKDAVAAESRFRLATLEGRFDEALAALTDLEAPFKDSPEDGAHAYFLQQRAALLFETRRPWEAVTLARDYAKRRAAWRPDPDSLGAPLLASRIAYLAGALSRDAFVRERSALLGVEGRPPPRGGDGRDGDRPLARGLRRREQDAGRRARSGHRAPALCTAPHAAQARRHDGRGARRDVPARGPRGRGRDAATARGCVVPRAGEPHRPHARARCARRRDRKAR